MSDHSPLGQWLIDHYANMSARERAEDPNTRYLPMLVEIADRPARQRPEPRKPRRLTRRQRIKRVRDLLREMEFWQDNHDWAVRRLVGDDDPGLEGIRQEAVDALESVRLELADVAKGFRAGKPPPPRTGESGEGGSRKRKGG